MSNKKGPCDPCDCTTSCPCVCTCLPVCNCRCIKDATLENTLSMDLDSVIALRRIKGVDLATLAAALDVNASIDIFLPGHKSLEKVSIEEFSLGTLEDAIELLGLTYK